MNKLQTTILITSLAILAISLLPVSSVSAQAPNLVVEFEQTPLFNEANFLPGGTVTRWVDVTNNTSETKTIGVKAKNYTTCSQDCLADQLNLLITDGSSNLYEDSLADFFAAGEKKLSDLGAGATIRYYFTVAFVPGAGNDYQDKQVGFDFDIGIFGQETIGGGGDTGGGGGIPGGGGGYFGGDAGLIIFDEAAAPVVSGQTDVTWQTNHPATSRVIYSAQSESHIFQLENPPNYGYARSTAEDSSFVTSHSINVAGLEPGVTYYYRCVSHGSFAVSAEHSFTVPGVMAAETGSAEESTGNTIALNQGAGGEEIAEGVGEGTIGGESTGGENAGEEPQNEENLAQLFLASLSALFDKIDFCSILFLLIVVVIALLLRSLLNKEKDGEDRKRKWIWSLVTTVVLIILYGFFCPYYKTLIIVIAVLFILFFLLRYYRKSMRSKNP